MVLLAAATQLYFTCLSSDKRMECASTEISGARTFSRSNAFRVFVKPVVRVRYSRTSPCTTAGQCFRAEKPTGCQQTRSPQRDPRSGEPEHLADTARVWPCTRLASRRWADHMQQTGRQWQCSVFAPSIMTNKLVIYRCKSAK